MVLENQSSSTICQIYSILRYTALEIKSGLPLGVAKYSVYRTVENRNFPVLAPYSLRVLNKLLSSACFHFLISKGMILYCPTRLLEWSREVIYENRRASAVPSSHFDNNIITALTTDALGHDLKKFCYSQGIRARMSEWKTKILYRVENGWFSMK